MMRSRIAIQALWIMFLLYLGNIVTAADRREIIFPVDGTVTASPSQIAFAYNGQIGFTIGYSISSSTKLFSFSVAEGKVLDSFDFAQDFGRLDFRFQLNTTNGRIVVFAPDLNHNQKVVALASDQSGRFTKLWAVTYPNPNNGIPFAIFNEEGSRVYAFYNDSTPKLAMLDAESGSTIAVAELPEPDIHPSALNNVQVLYDKVNDRPVVISNSGRVHVFAPGRDRFEVEWSGNGGDSQGSGLGFSPDGRYLITYTGYEFCCDPSSQRSNIFYSIDLQDRKFRRLTIKSKLLPSDNILVFHPHIRALFVPYSSKIKVKGSQIKVCACGSRLIDMIGLGGDGSLVPVTRIKIPRQSQSNSDPSLIGAFNSVALSESGAMGFVSTANRRIFAFDTMTGEVVNEVIVPDNLTYIYSTGQPGVLLYATANIKLGLLDVSAGPAITSVEIKNNRTIIRGENFLFGARVQLNGADIDGAERNPQKPGREIILERGRMDFPSGELTFVVVNRDGISSTPFLVSR